MPRVIYSLCLECEHEGDDLLLIAPLDWKGQSPHCRACPPKIRVIDLRVGDYVQHRTNRYRIKKISAYREAKYEGPPKRIKDGYLVPGSARQR